eukprot:CAMPEP_0202020206 /NCGR_PEP_ID=MMETSP0905-20130828/43935_1 /ASSEMBLY_ACC=CAM_ASM_000554 /TAXON_ID=420261 /ORGANISM="Thalassiosira antarctica, Strain CCMP982" /LENGTH=381 /DNA_ID=CAMNT_0048581729 /DNA_START=16 /DNA_END=1161 /DNA_ORIENTATION=+
MASMPSATAKNLPQGGLLTTAQFQDALAHQMDASKPDPLAKGQMENLRLRWEQHQELNVDDGLAPTASAETEGVMAGEGGAPRRWPLCGTLTLSSEFISIAIHVSCNCKTTSNEDDKSDNSASPMGQASMDQKSSTEEEDSIPDKYFQNEFYIQLTVTANLLSTSEHDNPSTKEEKLDRKERATKRKLRAGMMKRLRSDRLIQQLLIEEDTDCAKKEKVQTTKKHPKKIGDGLPLCEALIQKNCGNSSNNAAGELEERVNVHEDSLEGIRNALFSHCQDNLDVLEILLNLPYFPRRSTTAPASQYTTLSMKLAERAYLRLLEDAMFDACEKEGEDDLLDDLTISGANHDDDDDAALEDAGAGKGGRKKVQSKRMKSVEDRW